MYLPSHFNNTDRSSILELLRQFPLATVIYHDQGMLQAEHLPCLHTADISSDGAGEPTGWGRLFCHAAIGNRLSELALAAEPHQAFEVLLIFQGPSAYVRPAWYEAKARSGEVVPTYNYSVVQIRGLLRPVRDNKQFATMLAALSDQFEQARQTPWRMNDAPAPFLDELMTAITGFEIQITDLQAKAKMSQNKIAIDRQNIADGLRAEGQDAVAELVEQQLFKSS